MASVLLPMSSESPVTSSRSRHCLLYKRSVAYPHWKGCGSCCAIDQLPFAGGIAGPDTGPPGVRGADWPAALSLVEIRNRPDPVPHLKTPRHWLQPCFRESAMSRHSIARLPQSERSTGVVTVCPPPEVSVIFPFTSSADEGDVVPMPTLPRKSILSGLAVADRSAWTVEPLQM